MSQTIIDEDDDYLLTEDYFIRDGQVHIHIADNDFYISPSDDELASYKLLDKTTGKITNYEWVDSEDYNKLCSDCLTAKGLNLYEKRGEFYDLINYYNYNDITEQMPADCLTWLIENDYVDCHTGPPATYDWNNCSADYDYEDGVILLRNVPELSPFTLTHDRPIKNLRECVKLLTEEAEKRNWNV